MQTPMLIICTLFAILVAAYPVALLTAFKLEKTHDRKLEALRTIVAWRDLVFYKPYMAGVVAVGFALAYNTHYLHAAAVVLGFWISQAVAQWSIAYYCK